MGPIDRKFFARCVHAVAPDSMGVEFLFEGAAVLRSPGGSGEDLIHPRRSAERSRIWLVGERDRTRVRGDIPERLADKRKRAWMSAKCNLPVRLIVRHKPRITRRMQHGQSQNLLTCLRSDAC
jgi:hypothetical protein